MIWPLKRAVRNFVMRRLDVPDMRTGLVRLRENGLAPQVIFDVGAYRGDFARLCREIWRDAQIACFEILPNQLERLRQLSAHDRRLHVFETLLGPQQRSDVPVHEAATATSVLEERASAPGEPWKRKQFPIGHYPMSTVDQMVQQHFQSCPPCLLKLDVQGFELEVLKGAELCLGKGNLKAIIAEVNLLDLHKDCPLLADLVAWLDYRNWVIYDICGFGRRPKDSALWQIDAIFVRRESWLRIDKRWGGRPVC